MKKTSASARTGSSVLESRRADLSRCVKCGSCRAVCPVFLPGRQESLSPRGRVALIGAVLEGRLSASDVYEDRLASCAGCLACEEVCASRVPVTDLIQAAKEQAVAERGAGLIRKILGRVVANGKALDAASWLAPLLLHYRPASMFDRRVKGRSGRGIHTAGTGRTRGTVAFFPGCSIASFQKETGTAAIRVLSRAGYRVIVPEGLRCCGRPLLSLGDRDAVRDAAGRNAAVFSAVGADAVITACASCSLTFKREYPKLLPPGARVPPVLDIHEFLEKQQGGLELRTVRRTVTWHDPCHLGRGQGLSETARRMLLRIPGLTLVEMENPDRCCGFGGVMRLTRHALSDSIADEKAGNIIATGAEAVVTGCPSCRTQIAEGLRRAGSEIEALHTVQLIDEALGREDR